jgi:hypothetical protein
MAAWQIYHAGNEWRNPLAQAQFTPLTDFPGTERDAAISRDGKFAAFISDQDGPLDVWVGQIGTGEFQNLTKGRAPDVGNPRVRAAEFSPDGSRIVAEGRVDGRAFSWSVPTMGGAVRPFFDGAEFVWSPDGKRLAYHTDDSGDPIFVSTFEGKAGTQIYAAAPGVHCHYLAWSPRGDFIYFVQGFPPDEMDIWRVRDTGGRAERLTFHNSRVAYPAFLNDRTLIYTAQAQDGAGPWLYGMDVKRRVPHRLSLGVERSTAAACSPPSSIRKPPCGASRFRIVPPTILLSLAWCCRRCGDSLRALVRGTCCIYRRRVEAMASGGSPTKQPPSCGVRPRAEWLMDQASHRMAVTLLSPRSRAATTASTP